MRVTWLFVAPIPINGPKAGRKYGMVRKPARRRPLRCAPLPTISSGTPGGFRCLRVATLPTYPPCPLTPAYHFIG